MARNSTQSVSTVQAPEGFRRLGSVANAGWFNMKKVGNVLAGTLEGMFERNDGLNPKGKSKFFQVQVSVECEVRMGRGDEAAIQIAKPGDFVNLNYGPKTSGLEDFIPKIDQGAAYELWGVVAGEKIKLTGGRSMHNFDLRVKQIRAPKAADDESPDFTDADPEGAQA